MERKSFLKSLLLGVVTVPVALSACEIEADAITPSAEGTVTNPGTSSDNCTIAPTQTQGPFPTKSPASNVRSDITDGRTGYKLTVKITLWRDPQLSITVFSSFLDFLVMKY